MTTQRQIAANRRNAQMSTGPRTMSGKAVSSGNARRHGLTGDLDEEAVLSWYRILLEDETAVPDPFEQDPHRRAAAELARAEAHLQRVRATEEQSLEYIEVPSKLEKDLEYLRDHVAETLLWEILSDKSKTEAFRLVPDDEQWLLPPKPPFDREDSESLLARLAASERQLGIPVTSFPPFDEAAFEAESEAYFDKLEKFVRSPFVKVGWDKDGFGQLRRLEEEIDIIRSERREAHERVAPTFSRYRALAEARRSRALARWTDQVTRRGQAEGSK
jgi:hypothetical protein